MIQEAPSKAWIPITAAIITGACAVIAAIVTLGAPFAERIADRYYPPFTPTPSPAETETLIPHNIPAVAATDTTAIGDFLPTALVSEKDGMVLLLVPEGEFIMGSDANPDERPVHSVSLSAFRIDQTEVTNSQYAKCVSAGICSSPSQLKSYTRNSYYGNSEFGDYPVIYVSWGDAKTYCRWVGRDLPTEAQWEKAASWNNLTKESYIYPWGDGFDGSIVNFCDVNCLLNHADKNADDGYVDTSPVMDYELGVSPYGAYDMAGNVWEWVNDWYSEVYYSNSPLVNPPGPDSGTYRVLRGDSWWGYSYGVRSADRNPLAPVKSANNVGFRCAVSNP